VGASDPGGVYSLVWEPEPDHVKSIRAVSKPRINKCGLIQIKICLYGSKGLVDLSFIVDWRRLPGIVAFGNQILKEPV